MLVTECQPAGWEIGFAFFAVDKFSYVTLNDSFMSLYSYKMH